MATTEEANARINELGLGAVEMVLLLGLISNLAPDVMHKALDVLERSITKRDGNRKESSNG